MWTEEGDGDFAARANLTFEAFADFCQGEIRAEMGSEFRKTQAGAVKARLARASVIIVIGDVFQIRSLESCVVHARNVQPTSCGWLVYKSYSVQRMRLLYKKECSSRHPFRLVLIF
jgi:hypothetical protein